LPKAGTLSGKQQRNSIWSALAERSGDSALDLSGVARCLPPYSKLLMHLVV